MQTQIYVGLSGQLALQHQLDVVANNVANMNTVGFRGEAALFDAHMERTQDRRQVAFVLDRFTYTDMRSGDYQKTGNPLDVALSGDGWLQVQTPGGTRYTRDGRLSLDAAGTLVTLNGAPVLDAGGGTIQLPNDVSGIQILKDGTISDGERNFGRLGAVRLPDNQAMKHEAGGLYVSAGQPVEATDVEIHQGMVEQSNVQPVVAMTQLIELSKAYEMAKSLVDGGDETLRGAIHTIGKVD